MERYCLRCCHYEKKTTHPSPGSLCPSCGAILHSRRRPSPSPKTHLGALIRAIFSVPGLFFLGLFSVVFILTSVMGFSRLALLLLYAGALRLSWRSMNMTGEDIDFPTVGGEDLLNPSVLFAALAYSIIFQILPLALFAWARVGTLPLPATVLLCLLLAAYMPMALVLYLRFNRLAGMLAFPTAARILKNDTAGYGRMAAMMLSAQILSQLLFAAALTLKGFSGLLLSLLLSPLVGVAALLSFGVAGLYVRSQARVLQLPCDDDDWKAHGYLGATPEPKPAQQPQAAPPVAPPAQPVAIVPLSPTAPAPRGGAPESIPTLQGQLLAPGPAPSAAPLVATSTGAVAPGPVQPPPSVRGHDPSVPRPISLAPGQAPAPIMAPPSPSSASSLPPVAVGTLLEEPPPDEPR